MAELADPHDSDAPRQLHGWKDISAYFGRSVRTVQRWERDFGLPIRRFGMGRAEVVHAYVEELDRWKATAEAEAAGRAGDAVAENAADAPSGVAAAPVSGGRRFTTRLAIPAAAALLVLTAVALVLAWQSRGRIHRPRGPRSGRLGSGGEPALREERVGRPAVGP